VTSAPRLIRSLVVVRSPTWLGGVSFGAGM